MDDTLTIDCPTCGQQVTIPVSYQLKPPDDEDPGIATVTIRVGEIDHGCPPPAEPPEPAPWTWPASACWGDGS
jgi:hypothetical protein